MNSSDFDSVKSSNCDQVPQQQYYYMPYMPATPNFPTGLPLGPQTSPMPYSPEVIQQPLIMPPMQGMTPQTPGAYIPPPPLFSGEAPAQTVMDTDYTAGYLRTLIGRVVVVDFLLGTNTMVDKSGQLVQVGASYIVLKDVISGSYTMCDLYSIKFVRIYR